MVVVERYRDVPNHKTENSNTNGKLCVLSDLNMRIGKIYEVIFAIRSFEPRAYSHLYEP